mmetsp:Transcript_11697/g.31499  ORF Transcript_11697/g.31499 Transcript_11697/m.31499 type:complete len:223 (+) Transcript_11697:52-720(+)
MAETAERVDSSATTLVENGTLFGKMQFNTHIKDWSFCFRLKLKLKQVDKDRWEGLSSHLKKSEKTKMKKEKKHRKKEEKEREKQMREEEIAKYTHAIRQQSLSTSVSSVRRYLDSGHADVLEAKWKRIFDVAKEKESEKKQKGEEKGGNKEEEKEKGQEGDTAGDDATAAPLLQLEPDVSDLFRQYGLTAAIDSVPHMRRQARLPRQVPVLDTSCLLLPFAP